jgi:hypothetical protein
LKAPSQQEMGADSGMPVFEQRCSQSHRPVHLARENLAPLETARRLMNAFRPRTGGHSPRGGAARQCARRAYLLSLMASARHDVATDVELP